MLDTFLTQLGLKLKNMVVLDLNFPSSACPEFHKVYETRFMHVPCRQGMALEVAGGIASFGKIVVVVGSDVFDVSHLDPTLNVKVLRVSERGSWEGLEEGLRAFGPAVLEIPV